MAEQVSHPRTVVVTGATGRLGRMLRHAWALSPPEGMTILWSARNLPAGVPGEWLAWDLTNQDTVLPQGCVILHLAAVLRGNGDQMALNSVFARTVAQAAQACDARHVLFASSISVLGPSDEALTEASVPAPKSDYARAKFEAEQVSARAISDLTVLRIGNVLGADALMAAATSGASLPLDPVPDQRGGPLRTWIGPAVLASVLAQLIERVFRADHLPTYLNVAAQPPIAMADILDAAGVGWHYAAPNPLVNARSIVVTELLRSLVDVPVVTALSLVQDWRNFVQGQTQ